MHCIRVELRLADGFYELHPAPEDEGVAELPPPEADAVQAEEQLPSSLFEGKPRMHESPVFYQTCACLLYHACAFTYRSCLEP